MQRASRIAAAALLSVLAGTVATAQDQVLQDLSEALERGRYDTALQRTDELADGALAAEWRSYLHSAAGDVPGALREARAGLELAPEHPGLLALALNASLTLGLAQGAQEFSRRLLAAAEQDPALAARAEELARLAREVAQRERLAERGVARARAVALTGLLGALLALALLARSAPPGS